MENQTYRLNFRKLCEKLNLGQLTTEPEQVQGGFLHRMYHLKTSKEEYAVKALNPQIMKRETALDNYIFSEKVSNLALQNEINALPAIISCGSSIHEVEGQYYLLFPWTQGKTLPTGIVDMDCCTVIGETLAKIHRIDLSQLLVRNEDEIEPALNTADRVDWKNYALKGKRDNLEWSSLLLHHLDKIYYWDKLANASAKLLMNNQVISHRDLDQKNVLWDKNKVPTIIDWEAAGAINPTLDLIDVALYWSGFESGNLNKDAFCSVIHTYVKHGGKASDNWMDALNCGFQGKLEWLAYNIRRSLRLESTDDSEQQLGINEVTKTIQLLNDYADFIPLCMEWIGGMNDER